LPVLLLLREHLLSFVSLQDFPEIDTQCFLKLCVFHQGPVMAAMLMQKRAELSGKLMQHLGLGSEVPPEPQAAAPCALVVEEDSTPNSAALHASVQLMQAEEAILPTLAKIQTLSYMDTLRGGSRRKAEDLLTR
jgi:hypothetical protein